MAEEFSFTVVDSVGTSYFVYTGTNLSATTLQLQTRRDEAEPWVTSGVFGLIGAVDGVTISVGSASANRSVLPCHYRIIANNNFDAPIVEGYVAWFSGGSSVDSNFHETVQDLVAKMIIPGDGVSVVYDDAAGKFRISAIAGSGGTGESAYQIAVRNGFVGTEVQWLASLKGPQGAQGPAGAGFRDRGAWKPTTNYEVNDVVISNNTLFCVKNTHTSGTTAPTAALPGVNLTVWIRGEAASGLHAPSAPSSLMFSKDDSLLTATISWSVPASDGGSPITGYRVGRDKTDSNNAGAYEEVLASTARTFTFSKLVPGTTYTLYVKAINAIGESAPATAVVIMGGSILLNENFDGVYTLRADTTSDHPRFVVEPGSSTVGINNSLMTIPSSSTSYHRIYHYPKRFGGPGKPLVIRYRARVTERYADTFNGTIASAALWYRVPKDGVDKDNWKNAISGTGVSSSIVRVGLGFSGRVEVMRFNGITDQYLPYGSGKDLGYATGDWREVTVRLDWLSPDYWRYRVWHSPDHDMSVLPVYDWEGLTPHQNDAGFLVFRTDFCRTEYDYFTVEEIQQPYLPGDAFTGSFSTKWTSRALESRIDTDRGALDYTTTFPSISTDAQNWTGKAGSLDFLNVPSAGARHYYSVRIDGSNSYEVIHFASGELRVQRVIAGVVTSLYTGTAPTVPFTVRIREHNGQLIFDHRPVGTSKWVELVREAPQINITVARERVMAYGTAGTGSFLFDNNNLAGN